MHKRLIIIDISSWIFRAFFAIRHLSAPDGTPVNAVHGVLNMLLKLFSVYRPTHILVARDTAGGSFRNELYKEYKANRSAPPEELIPQFALIKQLLEVMQLPHCEDDNYEADDIIGTACVQWRDQFDEILIASGDKDLMQFVGGNIKMVDTMKDKIYDEDGVFEKMGVRPDQIVDYLSMVGDTSDNIPGMKGIGAKGAAKLLAEYGTFEKIVENKSELKGKKVIEAFTDYLDNGLLSKKLIAIVTDLKLACTPESSAYQFYPSEELISFLKGLGFKSSVQKLIDMKHQVAQAQSNDSDDEVSFINLETENHQEKIEFTKIDGDSFESTLSEIKKAQKVALFAHYQGEDRVSSMELSSLALSFESDSASYVLRDSQLCEKILGELWADSTLTIISDRIQTDLVYAALKGIEIKASYFDISQVHYNISSGGKHDLSSMAREYFEADLLERNKKEFASFEEAPPEFMERYLGQRSYYIAKLEPLMRKELEMMELTHIYNDIDNPMHRILAKMEAMGVLVDVDFFKNYEDELQAQIDTVEGVIESVAGEKINLNSPKQVGELLFEKLGLPVLKKTKTGASTDVEVLEKLSALGSSEIPGLMLQYRELSKLQSTYVKAIPELVDTHSRVHTHFNQNVAQTGRLSSTNPNLQNIPVRTESGRMIRKGFVAADSKVLVGLDYSQVELRLLAHFSGDPTMVHAFKEGHDIHAQTASEVLGVELKDVTREDRSRAKAVNFGLMYGQSSFGLASSLGISRTEAKTYIDNYFKRFNKVKAYLDELKERCEQTGYAITLHGRKRLLPDIHSQNRTIKAMAERMAINSPIQGTAADIIKLAMIKIDQRLTSEKLASKMILQVHDELIFECPEDEVQKVQELAREEMESVVSLNVPLKVDIGVGKNWYELK